MSVGGCQICGQCGPINHVDNMWLCDQCQRDYEVQQADYEHDLYEDEK